MVGSLLAKMDVEPGKVQDVSHMDSPSKGSMRSLDGNISA